MRSCGALPLLVLLSARNGLQIRLSFACCSGGQIADVRQFGMCRKDGRRNDLKLDAAGRPCAQPGFERLKVGRKGNCVRATAALPSYSSHFIASRFLGDGPPGFFEFSGFLNHLCRLVFPCLTHYLVRMLHMRNHKFLVILNKAIDSCRRAFRVLEGTEVARLISWTTVLTLREPTALWAGHCPRSSSARQEL